MSVVELVWCSIGIPAFTDNQDVWALTEWVGEYSSGSEIDIGVVAWSLASRAAVEVPLRKVIEGEFATLWDLGKGLRGNLDLVNVQKIVQLVKNLGDVAFSPLTWNEHHQWSRSRCTCL